jgi:hypothetical protein
MVARFAISLALLLGLVIGVSTILERAELSAPVRIGLALLPVAAYVACLVSYLGLIRQTDELQRRVHLEALAIAFPSTAVLVFAAEYMRKAGLISQFKPDYVLVAMLVLWGVGFLVAWRRYQ